MPSRNIVREIKAESIRDINPSDIIYLALKDGSILLVVENDDDTVDYDEIKLDYFQNSSRKRSNIGYNTDKYHRNNRNTKQTKKNTTYTKTDNRKNIATNNYSSYSRGNTHNTSYSIDRRQNKSMITLNKNDKKNDYSRYKNTRDNLNKTYNYDKKIYSPQYTRTKPNISKYTRTEKLERSYDITNNNNNNYRNHTLHQIEYSNKRKNSFQSQKKDPKTYQRPQSTNTNYKSSYRNNNNGKERTKVTSYSTSKTPSRQQHKGFTFNNNDNNNSIINISNLSLKNEKNFVNKTHLIEKKNIYKDYLKNKQKNENENKYKNINSFKRGEQIKTKAYTSRNAQTPNYSVKKKEFQIIGKITNNDKSVKLVENKYLKTTCITKSKYIQNESRNNKQSLNKIKEESTYNNNSFHVSYGGNLSKNGKSKSLYKAY